MKFIGRAGSKYIVQISDLEICNILGFDSLYSDGWKKFIAQYEVENSRKFNSPAMLDGAEIDVVEIAKKAAIMRRNEEKIKSAIDTFRGMADALEMAWPSLRHATEASAESEE